MTTDNRALGAEGEARAARLLRSKGFRILGRNQTVDGVELDLIVSRRGLVVFVEVKARRSRLHGPPELAVDDRKQRRLTRGARGWLQKHPGRFQRARLDVITCEVDGAGNWTLRHLERAFEG